MRSLAVLLIHFLTSLVRLSKPSGHKALIAENLLLKQQLLVIARGRQRAPHLKAIDRLILGWIALLISPARIAKSAIIIKPSTLLRFHKALVKKKYFQLFSCTGRGKPGPKGPRPELVKTIVAIKQRNPRYGCPRIAQIISYTFGIDIDKDVVRRVLEKHYRPEPGRTHGPSWLSFLGNIKDNLWSIDLFKAESITLRSHWVLLVMEQWSRQIVGLAVHAGPLDGPTVCYMFNHATSAKEKPKYLSTDHDPLFRHHRWQANLRIMGIEEIKTVPYSPLSHPYIERLIGTIRRECLDHMLFWNASALERNLQAFIDYYNKYRVHSSLDGIPPRHYGAAHSQNPTDLNNFAWLCHCNGLFHTPIPA